MRVALTGATGFIGSHVLTELQEHGHEVTALVRDDAQADIVAARGATRPWSTSMTGRWSRACSAMRTESSTPPAPETRPARTWIRRRRSGDRGVRGHRQALPPHQRPVDLRPNSAITEESPVNPPALVSWKEPIERRVLDAKGMRGVVVVSGVAYGDGGGGSPGSCSVRLETTPETGHARHGPSMADGSRRGLGEVIRRALENDAPVASTSSATEWTRAWPRYGGGRGRGRRPGAVPGSEGEARARLGDLFAEVLLLDQGANAAKARAELDGNPPTRGLSTSYATGAIATTEQPLAHYTQHTQEK